VCEEYVAGEEKGGGFRNRTLHGSGILCPYLVGLIGAIGFPLAACSSNGDLWVLVAGGGASRGGEAAGGCKSSCRGHPWPRTRHGSQFLFLRQFLFMPSDQARITIPILTIPILGWKGRLSRGAYDSESCNSFSWVGGAASLSACADCADTA
jgi:hypothetical protein